MSHKDETLSTLKSLAEEQVIYLKNQNNMRAQDIIRLYGGEPMSGETYWDAVERVVVFNMANAAKNGFVA